MKENTLLKITNFLEENDYSYKVSSYGIELLPEDDGNIYSLTHLFENLLKIRKEEIDLFSTYIDFNRKILRIH